MTGFIMVPRGTATHSLFKDNPKYLAAYIWLLEVASTEARQVNYAGQEWQLNKGEMVYTVRKLSTALKGFGFTVESTRLFLKKLNKYNLVTTKTTKEGSILTVKNNTANNTPKNTRSNTPKRTATKAKRTTRNTPNNTRSNTPNNTQINNGSINTSPLNPPKGSVESLDLFNKFWLSYPEHRRKNERKAKAIFLELTLAEQQAALRGLENVKPSVQWTKEKGQYVPSPCKWLESSDFAAMVKQSEAAQARAAEKAEAEAQAKDDQTTYRNYEKYLQGVQNDCAQSVDLEALRAAITSRTARTMLEKSGPTSPTVRPWLFEVAKVTPQTLEQWSKNNG